MQIFKVLAFITSIIFLAIIIYPLMAIINMKERQKWVEK